MPDNLDPNLYYRISDLPPATDITGNEVVEAIQNSKNVKFTLNQLMVTGKSAYTVAVDNGFVGTEEQWLGSLKGRDGTASFIESVKVEKYYFINILSCVIEYEANFIPVSKTITDSNGNVIFAGIRINNNTIEITFTEEETCSVDVVFRVIPQL